MWSAAIDSAALFSNAGKGFGDGTCYLIPEEPTPCEPSGIVRGVCPAGWHLPRYGEWYALYHMTGNDERFLKSKTDWIEENDGTDSFGFGALPAGCCAQGNDFGLGKFASFWTSSGEVSNSRECRFEIGNMDYDELGDSAVTSASIRFVKDE